MRITKPILVRVEGMLPPVGVLLLVVFAGLFFGGAARAEVSEAGRRNLQALKDAPAVIVGFKFEAPNPVFIDGISLTYHADYPVYELTMVARDRVLEVLAAEGILDKPASKEPLPEPAKPYCMVSVMGKGGVRYRRTIPADQNALKLAQALRTAVGDEKAGHSDAPRALSEFVEHLAKRVAEANDG